MSSAVNVWLKHYEEMETSESTIVDVDPMIQDTVLLVPRRETTGAETPGFWKNARSVFSRVIMSAPEAKALRSGDAGSSSGSVGAAVPSLYGKETRRRVPLRESSSPSEERQFALLMHEEWVGYLEEEIALLKAERHALLENSVAGTEQPPPKGLDEGSGLHKLPKSPWSVPADASVEKEESSSQDDEQSSRQHAATSLKHSNSELTPPPVHKMSRQLTVPPNSAKTVTLPPLAAAAKNYRTFKRLNSVAQVPGGGVITEDSTVPAAAASRNLTLPPKLDPPLRPLPATNGSTLTVDAQSDGGQVWARFKSFSRKGRSPNTSVIGGSGGEGASMAAVKAAASGEKRINRVWNKMKNMVSFHKRGGEILAMSPSGSSLSNKLRSGQIFADMRGASWIAIACSDAEDDLISRSRYHSLLKQTCPLESEIWRDMNRTLPREAKFQSRRGQEALFNVIKACAVMDPEVGYCQGMAFLAAILLLQMEEDDAFCCFIFLLHRCGLRTIFLPDMAQLQVRLYQMSQLLLQCLPILHSHFEDLEIKPVMYAADWFLTLFARSLPLYLVHRVFDVVIAEKTGAIVFKLGIVLLQVCRRQLLQCPEMEFAMDFLKVQLPSQLQELRDPDLEELISKALRVQIPFEGLLKLETEYAFLAEEAATAAKEVQRAISEGERAVQAWQEDKADLERRLIRALSAQKDAEALAVKLQKQIDALSSSRNESVAAIDSSVKDSPLLPLEEDDSTEALILRVHQLKKQSSAVSEALAEAECRVAERVSLEKERVYSVRESIHGPPNTQSHAVVAQSASLPLDHRWGQSDE